LVYKQLLTATVCRLLSGISLAHSAYYLHLWQSSGRKWQIVPM